MPATANSLAKLALGIADNQALSNLGEALGARLPLVVRPQAGPAQRAHPAFAGHLATLAAAGARIEDGPPKTTGNRCWTCSTNVAAGRNGMSRKRRISLISLGGTISMTPTEAGVVPKLSADDLLAGVPGLGDVEVKLSAQSFRGVAGSAVTFADLAELAELITARRSRRARTASWSPRAPTPSRRPRSSWT